MCFAPLPNALWPQHPNLSKFEFSSFSTFFSGLLPIWWSKFRRGVLRDQSIPEGRALTRLILVCSLKSVKIVQNTKIILCCMWKFFHHFLQHLGYIFHIYHIAVSSIFLALESIFSRNLFQKPLLFRCIKCWLKVWIFGSKKISPKKGVFLWRV